MRIVCAWCKKLLGYKCPFCGSPLIEETIGMHIWLKCEEMLSIIYFDPDNMKETHGICPDCEAEQRIRREEIRQRKLEDKQTHERRNQA